MYAKKSNRRRTLSGKRLCAAFSAVAIAATTVGLAPANATVVDPLPPGVGFNITVFHNIDFVAVFGFAEDTPLIVDVIRNGVTIGTASGPSKFDDLEGLHMEINHGVDAPAVAGPGDCWNGHTPDVRPGDLIQVTHPGGTSSVLVDNITFSGAPVENPVTHDVEVRGVAKRADGTNIPFGDLDSGEFRDVLPGGQFRATPVTAEDPAVDGGFVMRYSPPYTGDIMHPDVSTEEERKLSLLGSGHATGFGHVDPLPAESMLVDGIEDAPGPAPGCEGSPSAQDAVTDTNHELLNVANTATGNLEISGVSFDASDVSVTVGSLPAVDATVTGTGATQSWTASVPMDQVRTLPEGNVEITMTSTRADGDVTGVSKTLMKDATAPLAAPSADLPANPTPAAPYVDTQDVSLTAAAGESIRYTLNGPDPTANTGTPYNGPIPINPGTTTLKAIAVDGADNAGPMLTSVYNVVQSRVPGAPSLTNVRAGNASATVSWAAPASDGNRAIIGYKLHVYRGASLVRTIETGLVRRATVRRLVNGTGYRFAAQAVNENGNGAMSPKSSMVVPRTVASKPRQVRGNSGARGGRDTVTATWVAPTSNGGSAITSYVVRAQRVRANGSLGASTVAVKPARARSARMALRSGSYRFTVRAVNGIGRSPWSNLSNRAQSR